MLANKPRVGAPNLLPITPTVTGGHGDLCSRGVQGEAPGDVAGAALWRAT